MASQELVTATSGLLLIYGAVILYFVIRGAMRTASITDYAVGSIKFSPVVVGLSLAASITSAATFIINPGFIALYGISGIIALAVVLPLGAFLSLIVLTKSFRKYGDTVKALTMAQWIGKRYGSNWYALLFGMLSLLLITFIVLICVGMTKVLSKALNADEWYVLIGLVVFVFGYMMFGGANSMVYTNTIQAILMLIVAVILLTSGYEHFSEGVQGFLRKLESIDPLLIRARNPESFLFRDNFEIIFCSLVVGIAVVCQPHIITKSLLLKSESDVNKYLLTGILVEILFFAVVIAGLYARLEFPDLTVDGLALKMDGIIPAYVVREFPVYIGLVVIMGLLSAGLSTLEGLIQSVSTTITSDLIEPLSRGRLGGGGAGVRRLIAVNKLVIILLAVISIFLSYDQLINPSLSVGIFAQNGVYAYFSAAFVPVLMGIFLRDVPKIAPIAATIVAVLVHFSVYYGRLGWYMQSEVRNPAVAATFAILASLLVSFLFYLIFRKKEKSVEVEADSRTQSLDLPAAEPEEKNNLMFDFFHAPKNRRVLLDEGIEIFYTDSGRGKYTLVFIHGLGSNHKCWRKNFEELQKHYRCIALDLPGYGQSQKGDYSYQMDFFAGQIRSFIDKLKLKDVVLVGHSMGGQIAMTSALHNAEGLCKLVLIAPAGFEPFSNNERQWIRNLYTPGLLRATPVEQIKRNFKINFYRFPRDAEFMIADRLKLREKEDEYDRYCRMIPKCVNAMLDQPVFDRLSSLRLPTLVLFGANDMLIPNKMIHPTLTPISVAESGADQLSDCHLEILSPCGHFVQWECAAAVNRSIKNYLG